MIWLVRHAQPLIAPGVCYGALDVPADAQATQQAAQGLAQCLPAQVRALVSPLQRCQQLAQALQVLRPDLRFDTELRLREMNFGSWEGQRWDALPAESFDAWTKAFWRHPVGGGECVADFMGRVAAVWDAAVAASLPDRPQVWLTHAGVIRAARLLASGQREVRAAADWPAAAPGYGQCWRYLAPSVWQELVR
ncbi:histidine phosphatase family protein [Rhodoferax sp.]|uniref:histidine phosphatase family protein n=1 Tax=Rhodoferax sp. TaxID=50421 RepID=UPI001A096395|nr:histidine phosphatase family protein [Rhodoferax sp.]MBE0474633.1 histidine phosphatase family protein [Rhodoferax sp.]